MITKISNFQAPNRVFQRTEDLLKKIFEKQVEIFPKMPIMWKLKEKEIQNSLASDEKDELKVLKMEFEEKKEEMPAKSQKNCWISKKQWKLQLKLEQQLKKRRKRGLKKLKKSKRHLELLSQILYFKPLANLKISESLDSMVHLDIEF